MSALVSSTLPSSDFRLRRAEEQNTLTSHGERLLRVFLHANLQVSYTSGPSERSGIYSVMRHRNYEGGHVG